MLDTHCHADHVTGAWLMQQATGCRIGISRRYQPPIQGADLPLDHGDRVAFGGRHLDVRATPGHTDGCLTLVLDDQGMAFTGDALLIRGAGRCDFQQGSARALYRSITREIFSLPDSCLLFPGHDYSGRTVSSVAEERAYNPRIGGAADERDFVGFMENLNLPHPKQIDVAVPANLRSGQPADGKMPRPGRLGAGAPDLCRPAGDRARVGRRASRASARARRAPARGNAGVARKHRQCSIHSAERTQGAARRSPDGTSP